MKNPQIQVSLVKLTHKSTVDPHKSWVIGTGPMPRKWYRLGGHGKRYRRATKFMGIEWWIHTQGQPEHY